MAAGEDWRGHPKGIRAPPDLPSGGVWGRRSRPHTPPQCLAICAALSNGILRASIKESNGVRMNVILFALTAMTSTAAGGLFALRFRDQLHLILGFTAGVLLGVVAFDILPEIFALANEHGLDSTRSMIALVVGFLLFHSAEKLTVIHHAQEESYAAHHHPQVGLLSALALVGHSFMDGVGIGLGFQVSTAVGVAVAAAVIAHDFADGLNTVSLMLAHG